MRPSGAAVARVIGVRTSDYHSCLRGSRGSLDAISRWIQAWSDAGMPPLEMVVTAQTALIRRSQPDGTPSETEAPASLDALNSALGSLQAAVAALNTQR